MMKTLSHIAVISALAISVMASAATTHSTKPPEEKFKNLKVLPKNISQKQLSAIMVDEFQDDLGVSCNFCHAENKETHKPDYASDEKPEKQIARAMMLMTNGINRKYFKIRHALIGDSNLEITCGSCHQGKPHPERF